MSIADDNLQNLLTEGMEQVERLLHEAVSQTSPIADATSRHLVSAGGKRLRPLLTLLTSCLGQGVNDAVVQAAVSVELIHLATLYHDDVMDSAPLRRGVAAAQEVWGNSVAILTGDLLFARASQLVADLGVAAVKLQAETFERLCLGQLHETVGLQAGESDPITHYLQVLSDKTASLVSTAARFGAMFGGASAEQVAQVGEFGEKLGVAFQLYDDVIDLSSDPFVTGKTPGTDLRERVPTMPVLKLRARVAQGSATGTPVARDDLELLALIDGDLSSDVQLGEVVARLNNHIVVAETKDESRLWAQKAIDCLNKLPAGPVKVALQNFAESLVERTH